MLKCRGITEITETERLWGLRLITHMVVTQTKMTSTLTPDTGAASVTIINYVSGLVRFVVLLGLFVNFVVREICSLWGDSHF